MTDLTFVFNTDDNHNIEVNVDIRTTRKSHSIINVDDVYYIVNYYIYDNTLVHVMGAMDKMMINALLNYHDINLKDVVIEYYSETMLA